ncbi:MAG: ribonuclease H-like domain-containing protein [Candidatus Omnitrophota bacterium]
MKKLILDIETVGVDFDKMDEASREYMLKYAEDEKEQEAIRQSTSFYPLTAEVVAIGMLNPDTDKTIVYYQNPKKEKEEKESKTDFIAGSEKEILQLFWKQMADCSQFITFNGRQFDCPFLMLRSSILKVKTTKNLVPYRYDYKQHVDLLDQLTFYGAMRRKFNLHMWCKAYGIKSPKESGITGEDVKKLFEKGCYFDIAKYCTGDLYATKELYLYWERYLKF